MREHHHNLEKKWCLKLNLLVSTISIYKYYLSNETKLLWKRHYTFLHKSGNMDIRNQ